MLLENFYKIIHIKEREDGKQAIEIELNPGHVLYQGHFPGQPVVPGVCTLQIIKKVPNRSPTNLCSMYRLLLPNSCLPSTRWKLRYYSCLSD